MPLQRIGKMTLKNSGGFVARMGFSYVDEDGERHVTGQSGDITLGMSKTVDPGDMGAPDGSIVNLNVCVVLGKDNEAKKGFIYEKGNSATAYYNISGTTLDNDLGLVEISK